jgi:hypothetical protein
MARTIKYQAFTFEVAGSGVFPVPMLHFDRCSPATETDAVNMIQHHRAHDAPQRIIHLIGFAALGYKPEPTAARWQTFGWHVIAGSVRRIEE